MPETENGVEIEGRGRDRVYQAAYGLFCRNTDWVTFFREVLGLHGIVRRNYPTPEALADFERTETYAEILQMLTRLRERAASSEDPQEPIRVITVRLPKSVHEALRVEAHERHTSMNKLCISKLVQFIDAELIPKEHWRSGAPESSGDAETEGPGADL